MGKEIREKVQSYLQEQEKLLQKEIAAEQAAHQAKTAATAKIKAKTAKQGKVAQLFYNPHLSAMHFYMLQEVLIPIFDQIIETVAAKDFSVTIGTIDYIRALQNSGEHREDKEWYSSIYDKIRKLVDNASKDVRDWGDKMSQIMFFETSLHRLSSFSNGKYTKSETLDICLFYRLADQSYQLTSEQCKETHRVLMGLLEIFAKHLIEYLGELSAKNPTTTDLAEAIKLIPPSQYKHVDVMGHEILEVKMPEGKKEEESKEMAAPLMEHAKELKKAKEEKSPALPNAAVVPVKRKLSQGEKATVHQGESKKKQVAAPPHIKISSQRSSLFNLSKHQPCHAVQHTILQGNSIESSSPVIKNQKQ